MNKMKSIIFLRLFKYKILILIFCLISFQSLFAANDEEKSYHFDLGALINHHVQDAHSWEIYHGFTVYLPVIIYSKSQGLDIFSSKNFYYQNHNLGVYREYKIEHEHITLADGTSVLDISITKNVLFLFFNSAILLIVFFLVKRGYSKNEGKAPKGIQSFFEPIIIFIRDEIVKPNIGPKYEKYLPYLLTLFFFIWFGNLLGLLPAGANFTGNIAVTLVLAIFTLIVTLFSGKKTYWMHMLDPLGNSMAWSGKILLYVILVPIELIGIFTKPFSLMIRLFANITAGHIIILSIIGLTFIFQNLGIGIISASFAAVMNFLELFVAILQAYVFTLLSSIYFGQAVEEYH